MAVKIEYSIYEKRMNKGWTTRDLAKKAGVSIGMINAAESRNKNISIATLTCIANALGVNNEELYISKILDDNKV